MQLLNLLATQVQVFGSTFDVHLNWIGDIIKAIIEGVAPGIGIILFSLILKGIVLPVDVIQRITMRKQNIKMKENQARMEKLQKQYANNKDLYNQKVMEMYKESGISMFSSCLPMIVSLVIFIVAINAFNAFSQYANIENYNSLVNAYNTKMAEYMPELTPENVWIETHTNGEVTAYEIVVKDDDGENSYLYYTIPATEAQKDLSHTQELVDYVKNIPNYAVDNYKRTYFVNTDRALTDKMQAYVDAHVSVENEIDEDTALRMYFEEEGALQARIEYETNVVKKTSFVWIKNIWVTDASYKHPVLTYDEFEKEVSREKFEINNEKYALSDIKPYTNAYEKNSYQTVTSQMGDYQSSANGYFILIALSIGTILLQQLVTNHAQKEQQKYSTVDGQSGMQQKTMMVTMTIMFAIFSFMYSSAFSIYLITSNIFSMLSTAVINKFVDMADKKKKTTGNEGYSARYTRTLGKQNKKDDK